MYFCNRDMFEFEPNKIANVTQPGSVGKDVDRFIAMYEKQCLEELLGECLAKELFDSFEITTVDNVKAYRLKSNATEPIKRLVNGYTYTPTDSDDCDLSNFWSIYAALFGWNYGCGCGCKDSTCTERKWNGLVVNSTILIGKEEKTEGTTFITDYVYYWYLLTNRTVTSGSGQQELVGDNARPVHNFSKRVDAYNRFIEAVLGKRGQTSLYRFLHDNKADYPTWVPNCNLRFLNKF